MTWALNSRGLAHHRNYHHRLSHPDRIASDKLSLQPRATSLGPLAPPGQRKINLVVFLKLLSPLPSIENFVVFRHPSQNVEPFGVN